MSKGIITRLVCNIMMNDDLFFWLLSLPEENKFCQPLFHEDSVPLIIMIFSQLLWIPFARSLCAPLYWASSFALACNSYNELWVNITMDSQFLCKSPFSALFSFK